MRMERGSARDERGLAPFGGLLHAAAAGSGSAMEAAEEGKRQLRWRQWRPGALRAERRDGGAEEWLHHPLLTQPKQLLHAATGAQKQKERERERAREKREKEGGSLITILRELKMKTLLSFRPLNPSTGTGRGLDPLLLSLLLFLQ